MTARHHVKVEACRCRRYLRVAARHTDGDVDASAGGLGFIDHVGVKVERPLVGRLIGGDIRHPHLELLARLNAERVVKRHLIAHHALLKAERLIVAVAWELICHLKLTRHRDIELNDGAGDQEGDIADVLNINFFCGGLPYNDRSEEDLRRVHGVLRRLCGLQATIITPRCDHQGADREHERAQGPL